MADHDPNTHDAAWVSISELARLKGLSKAAVSERVKGLVDKGQIATRPGKGKIVLVNLAAFDRTVGETTDLARAAGAETKRQAALPPSGDPTTPIYTAEQARHMAYKAESARLDLEERQGKLLPIVEIAAAVQAAAETLARAIDNLPSLADDLAAAVAKDGTTGARALLKTRARDMREAMSRDLTAILKQPPRPVAEAEEPPEP